MSIIEGVICIIFFCVAWICYIEYSKIRINKRKLSFKESMDLTELPIITMYQGENKFNFLLDTGSNDSILSKPASRTLKGTYAPCKRGIEGLGGGDVSGKVCATTLEYKGMEFYAEFYVSDAVTATFTSIKKATGVHIHGILGTKFLQRYRYVLDFNELVAYNK